MRALRAAPHRDSAVVRSGNDAPDEAAIEQAQLAEARGFATEMIFVATDSIDENLARILQRAQGGGHGASEREVRAIHEASLTNLGAAIDAFERVDIYDSTARWSTPQLVATSHDGRIERHRASPLWFEKALAMPES